MEWKYGGCAEEAGTRRMEIRRVCGGGGDEENGNTEGVRTRRVRGEWKYGECVEEAGVWGLDMEKGVTVEGAFGTDRGKGRRE